MNISLEALQAVTNVQFLGFAVALCTLRATQPD